MGFSSGRICWTLLPFLLSLAALVTLILVFVGDTSAPTSLPHSLYFTAINTTSFTYKSTLKTADWYTIGLWNYCSGPANHSFNNPTFCAARKAFYHFDPVATWNLNATTAINSTSSSLASALGLGNLEPEVWIAGLAVYDTASKWMWILYIAAFAAAGVTFVLSFAGCASRCGSVFTSFAAAATALFTTAASALATAVFLILSRTVNDKLGSYGIHAHGLAHGLFVTTWLGAAFALAAASAWTFTICCCAGDHSRKKSRQEMEYHRVPSPGMA